MQSYVVPLLVYVEKELLRASRAYSAASITDGRFSELLSLEIKQLLPKTAANMERISGELIRAEDEVLWQNVGNSCRQIMIEFAGETCELCGVELDPETKRGDAKSILKQVLCAVYTSGRFRDTLEGLLGAVWDHTQSVLHRPATNKKEVLRVFLWTGMLVSEFSQMIQSYNES